MSEDEELDRLYRIIREKNKLLPIPEEFRPRKPTKWEIAKEAIGEVVCFLFIVLIFIAWVGFRSGFGFVAW